MCHKWINHSQDHQQEAYSQVMIEPLGSRSQGETKQHILTACEEFDPQKTQSEEP